MGIPYGTTYTATVKGSAINVVECENCRTAYVYRVERTASSSQTSILWLDNQGTQSRSSQAAHTALEQELIKAVDPVACPSCGWFQDNMCMLLKRKRLHIALWISLPIAASLLIWGLFEVNEPRGSAKILFSAGAAVAVVGFVVGFAWSSVHEPNQQHPGPDGTNARLASASKGTLKADYEAANSIAGQQWQEKFHRYLLQTMIQMSSADGPMNEAERTSVCKIYLQVTEVEITPDQLRRTSQASGATQAELLQNLTQFGADLNDEAKALFIRAGIAVAAADGEVAEAEWKFLIDIAQALQMTQQHFDAILADLQSE